MLSSLSILTLACALSGVLWGPSAPVVPHPPRLPTEIPAKIPAKLEVALEARTEVGGPLLRLRDLAHVRSGSLWAAVPLGASPAPGATRVVTRAEVQRALQVNGFALEVVGAKLVRVSRRAPTRARVAQGHVLLSGRFVEGIAARFVRRELKLDPKAPLTLQGKLPLRWTVPRTSGSRLHARWARANSSRATPLEVVVEVRSGERAVASLKLSFERPAPSTSSSQATQPQPRSRPPARNSRPKPSPKAPTKSTHRGDARAEVDSVELIKRGSHVTLVIRSGSLTISSEGVAVKGGARGESIPVRVAKDRPLVVGRIVDRGRVVVELRPRESE